IRTRPGPILVHGSPAGFTCTLPGDQQILQLSLFADDTLLSPQIEALLIFYHFMLQQK
ncbi:Hypothetical predicted protein, partial [Scomber scombrus]